MKKIILITGGSDGIGASIAYLASRQDFVVCINYRQNQISAKKIVNEIKSNGGQAFAFQFDISNEQQVEELFKAVDSQVGIISALVNNAGIIEPQQKLIDITGERLQRVFATNVFGSFLCAREAIKRMSNRNNGQGGSIVNVSSMASKYGSPFEYIDYASTKGAIDTLTIGLSKEVAEENIRVNAVRPGIIDTEIHSKAGEPNRIERMKEQIPMIAIVIKVPILQQGHFHSNVFTSGLGLLIPRYSCSF